MSVIRATSPASRDLYGKNGNPHAEISQLISGYRFTDEEIGATMKQVYNETGYVLDPHGACGYQALIDNKLAPNETGLFLETAHPAKFKRDGRQNYWMPTSKSPPN